MQSALRQPGEGSRWCTKYRMGALFPLGWQQIQSAGRTGQSRQQNVRDEATESPREFMTMSRSSTVPFNPINEMSHVGET